MRETREQLADRCRKAKGLHVDCPQACEILGPYEPWAGFYPAVDAGLILTGELIDMSDHAAGPYEIVADNMAARRT